MFDRLKLSEHAAGQSLKHMTSDGNQTESYVFVFSFFLFKKIRDCRCVRRQLLDFRLYSPFVQILFGTGTLEFFLINTFY